MRDNKGFTLVELIVVIVILSILVGVTISGVYIYTRQARENIDISNVEALQSHLDILMLKQDEEAKLKEIASCKLPSQHETGVDSSEYNYVGFYWNDAMTFDEGIEFTKGMNIDWNYILSECPKLNEKLRTLFKDGLPKPQGGYAMGFLIGFNTSGEYKVLCNTIDQNFIIQAGRYKGVSVDEYIKETYPIKVDKGA